MNNMPPFDPKFIEEMKNQNDFMMEFAEKQRQADNKVLKKLFAGKIKQSFLIEMKEKITHRPDMMDLAVNHYDVLNFSHESMVLGKDNLELDVCKFITMYHFFNTLTLDDAKRASYHDDEEYKNKLSNQVVDAIKLRNAALMYNAKDSLEAYYPLTYSLFALNNFLIIEFDRCMRERKYPKIKNAIFRSQMQFKMLKKIKAILVLVDNNLIEEAFNPLRSLYELYMIYLTLDNCDAKVVERYCRYVEYQFEYQKTNTIAKEVEDSFNNLKNNGSKITKIDYLNFGWLDSILEYNYINIDERKYRIVDIANYLDMKYKSQIGSILYKNFRECSPLSHGFTGFLEFYSTKQSLCERVCYILDFLATDISSSYQFKLELNNINVLEYMQGFYKQQLEYDKTINENSKLRESLNKNYVNRIR